MSIDEDNKRLIAEEIKNAENMKTNRYVNLNKNDINTLKKDATSLINNLKSGSLSDLYSIVSDSLKKYDTNIKMSDVVKLAFMYKSFI